MRSLGLETKNQTVYQMIQEIDKDSKGEIDFDEFLDLMTSKLAGSDTEEDVQKIFNLFGKSLIVLIVLSSPSLLQYSQYNCRSCCCCSSIQMMTKPAS